MRTLKEIMYEGVEGIDYVYRFGDNGEIVIEDEDGKVIGQVIKVTKGPSEKSLTECKHPGMTGKLPNEECTKCGLVVPF